jgi:hypothetical protein
MLSTRRHWNFLSIKMTSFTASDAKLNFCVKNGDCAEIAAILTKLPLCPNQANIETDDIHK